MKGQQQVLYLSLSLSLFGTDFCAFLWENHKEYLLLLIILSTVYYLDPKTYKYTWMDRGEMELQEVKLMYFRAMFFSPAGGCNFRMK